MYALLVTIHLLACFIMLSAVLLQSGKGAEMGASFGGASQTIFGARGPTTFLSKLTVGAAIVFMLTSLSLGIVSRERSIATTAIPVGPPAPPQAAPAPSQDTGPEGAAVKATKKTGTAPGQTGPVAPTEPSQAGLPKVSPAPTPESAKPSPPVRTTP